MKSILLLTAFLSLCIIGYSQSGCTNPLACNYDPVALSDDGSCIDPTMQSLGNMSIFVNNILFGQLDWEFHPISHEPYVAFKRNDLQIYIARYSDCQWQFVGNPTSLSAGVIYNPQLEMHPVTGTPYIAYTESNQHFLRVKKLVGSEWHSVGPDQVYEDFTVEPILRFHPVTHEPHLLVRDNTLGDGSLTLLKFNGTDWEVVGNPGFFPLDSDLNQAIVWKDFEFHPATNEPIVAFNRQGIGTKTNHVLRFNGTFWVGLTNSIETGFIEFMNLEFDSSTAQPIIAYADGAIDDGVVVSRWNGMTWENFGVPGFSGDGAEYIKLSINPTTGNPFVGMRSYNLFPFNGSNKFYEWINNSWQLVLEDTDSFTTLLDHEWHPENMDLFFLNTSVNPQLQAYSCELIICDSDGDGISDDDELNIYGTNPFNSDSDGDGITDSAELNITLTDPNLPDSNTNNCDDLSEWGEICAVCLGDLNEDGVVNVGDLTLILGAFGTNCE